MATKPPTLLVPKQPAGGKPLRFTLSIKDPTTQDMLNAYQQCYTSVYHTAIDRNTMVEQMLLGLMQRDKDFVKFYSGLSKTQEAKAARAAEASAIPDSSATEASATAE